MKIDSLFSEDDLRRVEEAVGRAEESSRGELVVAAVERSGAYAGAVWFAACLGSIAALMTVVLIHWLGESWSFGSPFAVLVAATVGAGLGYLVVARSGTVRRWLTPGDVLDGQVGLAARAAFLEHEVFNTRDRSGVLLFLSLMEHRVMVLADEGIDDRVEPGEWQEIVDGVVAGIRGGRAAEALIEAIGRCGEILDRRGLERRCDDEDELPNRLRLSGDDDDPEACDV